MKTTARAFVVAALVLSALAAVAAQEDDWNVPEEAKAMKNPLEPTPEVLEKGAQLFKKNCVMCHGETAKGDGPATKFIKPAPPDISTVEAKNRRTDGEIFYMITHGKKPMPPMERKMTEEERWAVIHYLRTLQVN